MRKHPISTFFAGMAVAALMFAGAVAYTGTDPTGCRWDEECRAEEIAAEPIPVWMANANPEVSI